MIFLVQRFLEDYFELRGLRDLDQYAVKLANIYDRERAAASDATLLSKLHRVRTVFYRSNKALSRKDFETALVSALDNRFKKKAGDASEAFPGGVHRERARLKQQPRLTISLVLDNFKRAVESRAIEGFWKSRSDLKLQHRPESVGQGLLAVFAKGTLGAKGLVLREIVSGTGFIDVMLVLSQVAHIIEMKIMRTKYAGVSQLEKYMQLESRRVGWLLLFDARPVHRKQSVPEKFVVKGGVVRVVVVDINPPAPSSLR